MFGRLSIVAAILLVSLCAARAQTPSPDAMAAARSLVTTMKLTEQLKAIMPALLQGLKPAIVQNRPEVERDFDALAPKLAEAFAPHYETMVNGIAAVYASHFTAEELREVEAFYRAAIGVGGKDNGPPGIRPHYHPSYYAAFVIAPDGHNVEAVCHGDEG